MEKIVSFIYEGNDDMIDFSRDDIPPVAEGFVASLRLADGTVVEADREWRARIWEWWYSRRKNEIEAGVLENAARQLTGRK